MKWTSEQIEVVKKFYVEKGSVYCANILGMNSKQVIKKAELLKLRRREIQPEEYVKIDPEVFNRYYFEEELSLREIGKLMHKHPTTIKNYADSQGFAREDIRKNKFKSTQCIECNKELETYQHYRSYKFCSSQCSGEYKRKQWVQKWQNGEYQIATYETLPGPIRRYMFEKYNNKCQKCGWSKVNPATGKIPLTVNHIDGNWKNNNEDNLELICPNCHSLTPTYGALNKGNGRPLNKLRKTGIRKERI